MKSLGIKKRLIIVSILLCVLFALSFLIKLDSPQQSTVRSDSSYINEDISQENYSFTLVNGFYSSDISSYSVHLTFPRSTSIFENDKKYYFRLYFVNTVEKFTVETVSIDNAMDEHSYYFGLNSNCDLFNAEPVTVSYNYFSDFDICLSFVSDLTVSKSYVVFVDLYEEKEGNSLTFVSRSSNYFTSSLSELSEYFVSIVDGIYLNLTVLGNFRIDFLVDKETVETLINSNYYIVFYGIKDFDLYSTSTAMSDLAEDDILQMFTFNEDLVTEGIELVHYTEDENSDYGRFSFYFTMPEDIESDYYYFIDLFSEIDDVLNFVYRSDYLCTSMEDCINYFLPIIEELGFPDKYEYFQSLLDSIN